MSELDRITNEEIEMSFLGAVLMEGIDLDTVSFLRPEMFFILKHQVIYQAMVDLLTRDHYLDNMTLAAELKRRYPDNPENYGGGSFYITKLINNVPTHHGLEYYARIILIYYQRRCLLDLAQLTAKSAIESGDTTVQTVIDQARAGLDKIEQGSHLTSLSPIGDFASVYVGNLWDRMNNHQAKGLLLGISSLDKIVNGLQGGESMILVGRPGTGKTALALQIALNVAEQGKQVAFFSMEMGGESLAARMLSNLTRIDSRSLRNPDNGLSEYDFMRIGDASAALGNYPIFVSENPDTTVANIRLQARQIQQQCDGQLALIMVDYIQLMAKHSKNNSDLTIEISKICNELRIMAKVLKVPIILLAQATREADNKKENTLSDIAGSAGIERYADVVVILKTDAENPEIQLVQFLKNREGQNGITVELRYQKQYHRILALQHDKVAAYEPLPEVRHE